MPPQRGSQICLGQPNEHFLASPLSVTHSLQIKKSLLLPEEKTCSSVALQKNTIHRSTWVKITLTACGGSIYTSPHLSVFLFTWHAYFPWVYKGFQPPDWVCAAVRGRKSIALESVAVEWITSLTMKWIINEYMECLHYSVLKMFQSKKKKKHPRKACRAGQHA